MRRLLVACALGFLLAGCAAHEVVGYYAAWKSAASLATPGPTVINYAFADLSPDGTVALEGGPERDAALTRLWAMREREPRLRLLVSVGGWTRSNRFSDMAAVPAGRRAFVGSAIDLLRRQRFDGIDIDWEYPGEIGSPCPAGETCDRPGDKRNFVQLARELRAALDEAGETDRKRYLFTMAAGADEKFLRDPRGSEEWLRELAASLDWINLMSYDYHGAWERQAGLNAPLRRDPADSSVMNVEASVRRLLDNGIPAEKITLGIPFYGKGWAGCTPGPAGDGLYQPCTGLAKGSAAESFDFSALIDRGYLARDGEGRYTVAGQGFVRHWSAAARVPYLYDATTGTFITYDDEASVGEKARLAKAYRLRGTMFWEMGADRDNVLFRALTGASR